MDKEKLKALAAEKAVEEVKPGMVVGLGTGSTVYYVLLRLGERVHTGLNIVGIPTSKQTEEIARQQGIHVSTLAEYPSLDLTIDGADEVDPELNLIKGMGGALVREKIVAHASKRLIIIVDETKLVETLGTKSSLPVEVVSFGWQATQIALNRICQQSTLRHKGDAPFVSDNGNSILDCRFDWIVDPVATEMAINNIPGVVENGLFVHRADKVIVGTSAGIRLMER